MCAPACARLRVRVRVRACVRVPAQVHEEVKVADKWQHSTKSFEGELVIKAALRWGQLRSKCCGQRRAMYGSQQSWWETQLQSYVQCVRVCVCVCVCVCVKHGVVLGDTRLLRRGVSMLGIDAGVGGGGCVSLMVAAS